MSYTSLLNDKVTIFRPTQVMGALQSADKKWDTVATDVPAAVQVIEPEMRVDVGPGIKTMGRYKCFLLVGQDVEDDDLIQVTSPSGEFSYLQVDGVYRPRSRHTQTRCVGTTEVPT